MAQTGEVGAVRTASAAGAGAASSMAASRRETPAAAVHTADEYSVLHDVICDVAVVLGTGRMSVRQCLYLTPQTVVALDQAAGSDLRVLVNGVAIATGEVVIVDESTAIRLNHVLAPPNGEGRA